MTDLLIGGLAIGGVYALVGIGLVVVFRATGIINFAHGELLMVGTYAYVLASEHLSSPILQLLITLLAGGAAGMLCFVLAHVLLRDAEEFIVVLGTFALSILLQFVARLLFTDTPMTAHAWVVGDRTVQLGHTIVTHNAVMTIGISTVVAVALLIAFRYSILGKAMEAVAESARRSALTGIPVRLMLTLSWVVGGMLAALAGLFLVPITDAFPTVGTIVLLPAFFVAVIGGLDNIAGALVGGFALGLIQTFVVVAVGGAFRDLLVFGILVAVLLLRPTGIFAAIQLRRY